MVIYNLYTKQDQKFVITYLSKLLQPYTISKRFTKGEDKLAKAASKTISEALGSHTPKIAPGAGISKTVSSNNVSVNNQPSTLAQKTNPNLPKDNINRNLGNSTLGSTNKIDSLTEKTKHLQSGNHMPSKGLKDMIPSKKTVDLPVVSNTSVTSNPYIIPPAPPLPAKPLLTNKPAICNNNNLNQPNLLQQIHQGIQLKPVLKSFSGKVFDTNITAQTSVDNISNADLITELQKRELVKPDTGQTIGQFLDQQNKFVIIGESKYHIKLTNLGQAYSKKLELEASETVSTDGFMNVENIDNLNFMIVLPPKVSHQTFIESGEQKHLLVAFNKENNEYYAIGYFTSKTSVNKISDMQYKTFEDNKESTKKLGTTKEKSQNFVSFDAPKRIQPNDIKPVKYSKEYLANINAFSIFSDLIENLKKVPYKPFNTNGVTKKDAFDMCKEHDKIVTNKGSHPLTADQIKLQESAKAKQKQDQENMKEEKQKQKNMAKKEGLKKQEELKLNKNKNNDENTH